MCIKHILLAATFILIFCCVTFAQANQSRSSPDVPSGQVPPSSGSDALREAFEMVERQKALPVKREFKHDAKIKTEYDRFNNTTTVQLNAMQIIGGKFDGIFLSSGFVYPGHRPFVPKQVVFGLSVVLKGVRYVLPGDLTVLADGERLVVGRLTHMGTADVLPGWNIIMETMATIIPFDTFIKIVNAKKVEMKLDSTEFELKESNLEALRDLASRMQP